MRIEDLLEFEGLTAEMVRAWMVAHEWKRANKSMDIGGGQCWRRDEGAGGSVWLKEKTPLKTVESLAKWHGLSLQSLLAEINPRMRPGWPTEEELERHAFWMVRTLSDDGIRVLGAYVAREWKKAGIKVECWPCDQHGNKTRRGA